MRSGDVRRGSVPCRLRPSRVRNGSNASKLGFPLEVEASLRVLKGAQGTGVDTGGVPRAARRVAAHTGQQGARLVGEGVFLRVRLTTAVRVGPSVTQGLGCHLGLGVVREEGLKGPRVGALGVGPKLRLGFAHLPAAVAITHGRRLGQPTASPPPRVMVCGAGPGCVSTRRERGFLGGAFSPRVRTVEKGAACARRRARRTRLRRRWRAWVRLQMLIVVLLLFPARERGGDALHPVRLSLRWCDPWSSHESLLLQGAPGLAPSPGVARAGQSRSAFEGGSEKSPALARRCVWARARTLAVLSSHKGGARARTPRHGAMAPGRGAAGASESRQSEGDAQAAWGGLADDSQAGGCAAETGGAAGAAGGETPRGDCVRTASRRLRGLSPDADAGKAQDERRRAGRAACPGDRCAGTGGLALLAVGSGFRLRDLTLGLH
jgi:hypothetical protein